MGWNGLSTRLSRVEVSAPWHSGSSEHGYVTCLGRSASDQRVEVVVDLEFKAREPSVVLESEPGRSHHSSALGLAERWVAMTGALACWSWARSWCGWRAAIACAAILLFYTTSIPREGAMGGVATRNDERRKPVLGKRFSHFPRPASCPESGS